MNQHSFVAPEGDGYVAYLGAQYVAWDTDLVAVQGLYVSALGERETLHELACKRAAEASSRFSHTRPDGSTLSESQITELLAVSPSLQMASDAWQRSPAHAALLDQQVDAFGYCERGGYHALLGSRNH